MVLRSRVRFLLLVPVLITFVGCTSVAGDGSTGDPVGTFVGDFMRQALAAFLT